MGISLYSNSISGLCIPSDHHPVLRLLINMFIPKWPSASMEVAFWSLLTYLSIPFIVAVYQCVSPQMAISLYGSILLVSAYLMIITLFCGCFINMFLPKWPSAFSVDAILLCHSLSVRPPGSILRPL